jgi:hypothetical protein
MVGTISDEGIIREDIPTLTWKGLPYRVQILDNMVLLYSIKTHEQYVQTADSADIHRLKVIKSARLATAVLRAVFGKSLITDPLTPNEREAMNVFERVYQNTGDIQKADDAYAITMELLR